MAKVHLYQISYLIRLLLITVVLQLYACYNNSLIAQVFGKEMLGGESSVTIPFDYINGFLLVDVVYANTFNLRFVFDTGAEHTILFKKIYADLLATEYDQRINIYGADLSENIYALIARDVPLQLDRTKTIMKDFVVLEQDFLNLEEIVGTKIDGILGGEYLRGLIVEIDYDKKKITLNDPDIFEKDVSEFTEIPIRITRNKPYVIVDYAESQDSVNKAKVLLDTGASLACLFHHNSESYISLPSNVVKGNLGKGLGGNIEGYMGKIHNLQLGPYNFNNLVANYQSLDTVVLSAEETNRNGIIGNLILERFKVMINYQQQKLYLKPSKSFDKAFEYDKSGLFIYAFGPKLDQYLIKYVIPGSPAYEAGLMSGDIIKKIGWWSTFWYSLKGLSKKLAGKEGKTIKLKVERAGEELNFKFTLRDLFDDHSKPTKK